MTRQYLSPIHKPCPDMAGCTNPDPDKTANSLEWVQRCLQRVRQLKQPVKKTHIPKRLRIGGGV